MHCFCVYSFALFPVCYVLSTSENSPNFIVILLLQWRIQMSSRTECLHININVHRQTLSYICLVSFLPTLNTYVMTVKVHLCDFIISTLFTT